MKKKILGAKSDRRLLQSNFTMSAYEKAEVVTNAEIEIQA